MVSSEKRRVVISGLGAISPLGNTLESHWDALKAGRSGVGVLESLSCSTLPMACAGEARDFTGHIKDFGELAKDQKRTIRKALKVMCREIQMGVAAAQRCLVDAKLEVGSHDPERTGVVYGADYMMTVPEEFIDGVEACLDENREFCFDRWAQEGLPKVTPLWLLKYLPNMPASHIAIYNDLRGPNNSITLREAAGNLAIGEAYCTILRNSADIVLAGATGTRVHPMRTVHVAIQEELAAGNPPEEAARPFDLDRTGMVIGEGAGTIVLEEMEAAKSRGATIYGEMVGYGSSSVMSRSGKPDCSKAMANAMRQALRTAEMEPSEIGHIHAHGESTRKGDAQEAQAIQAVFGELATKVPVVAAKSYFGNLGAGSGVVELVSSLLAMREGELFPVLNYTTPDPECPLAVVGAGGGATGGSVLNLNVTPHGQASAVVVRAI